MPGQNPASVSLSFKSLWMVTSHQPSMLSLSRSVHTQFPTHDMNFDGPLVLILALAGGANAWGSLLARLAARIMWKIEREGSGLAEGCLVSIEDLQNHVDNFGEEEKKELRADVESFLEFWPPQSQQFGMQYISHIFGVVRWRGGRANGGLLLMPAPQRKSPTGLS